MDSIAASSDEPKKWDRPWTVDEMRHDAANWSLAGDSGLLNHIQDFSKKLLGRVHDTNQLMDDLMHEVKTASVRVDNAFNDFVMLANTQFVENRVYDDDEPREEEKEKKQEEEPTREQREAEVVARVKEAIQHGLAVVDDMFEIVHVDIGADSDSEEEDVPGESIMKVKNPYQDRVLPHLIGTEAFMNDDFVGLREESSSEESEEEEEEEESDEESEKPEKKSESDFSDDFSEPEKEIIPKKNIYKRQSSSSESDDNLFGDKEDKKKYDDQLDEDSENDVKEEDPVPKKPATDFASELARKIGAAPPAGTHSDHSDSDGEWNEEPKKKTTKSAKSPGVEKSTHESKTKTTKPQPTKKQVEEDEDDDLFPPEDDGQMSWSGGGGLFSGGGLFDEPETNLFDDISDNPNPAEKVTAKTSKKKVESEKSSSKTKAIGSVALFDDEDDLFADTPTVSQSKAAKPSPVPVQKSAPPIGADLFNGDESDQDDLFAPKPKAKAPAAKPPPSVDLFAADDGDEEDDMFAAKPPSAEKKKPSLAGAVPMFGGRLNPLAIVVPNRQPRSEDEPSIAGGGRLNPLAIVVPNRQPRSEDEPSLAGGGRLNPLAIVVPNRRPRSEDEASDDNQSTASSSRPAGKQERSPSVSSASNSLFADEPEDLPTVNRKSSKPAVIAIFDDEDEGVDDLFSAASKPGSQTSKPRAASLFIEDDDEDDLFASAKAKAANQKVKTPALVASTPAAAKTKESKPLFSPDEDLFGGRKQDKPIPAPVPKNEPSPKTKTKAISLFNEDDEEDMGNDLFTAAPKPAGVNKVNAQTTLDTGKPSHKPRKSLFADDDVLFGAADEDPNVDLFGPSSPLSPPTRASKSAEKQATVASFSPLPLDVAPVSKSDDVTSHRTSDQIEAKKSVSPARDKPVGGVSLFGGVDVLGIKAKRDSMFHDSDEAGDELLANHVDASPVNTKTTGEESAVSFEEPAAADTLHSLNKDRAKIGAKRRPPTRRGRPSIAEAEGAPEPETSRTQVKRPTLLEIAGASDKAKESGPASREEGSRIPPVDDIDSPDDLFQTPRADINPVIAKTPREDEHKTTHSPPSSPPQTLNSAVENAKPGTRTATAGRDVHVDSPDDLFSKKPARKSTVDIFGSPDGGDNQDIFSSKAKSLKTQEIAQAEDDIFGDLDLHKDDKKSKPSKVFDDSPSDIFNSPKLKPPPSGDDIFSTPSAKISSKPPSKVDPFASDSDEDIFKSDTKNGKTKDSFVAKEEDIFSTPPTAPDKRTAPGTKPDEDIFKDDTDIFADIPKKTKKSKKREDGTIFNDDVDDIFAAPSTTKTAAPTNKKTKTKKTKPKASSQQPTASIFDENVPSIFDDPLSALKS